MAEPDASMRPEEDDEPLPPRAERKPDDVAVVMKALDELEALQRAAGTKPDLEVRQALRRLAALAKLSIRS